MPFKKIRSVNLPYRKQVMIYAICINFNDQPENVQNKIINLCESIALYNHEALFKTLTSENRSLRQIAKEHYLSERQLERYRAKFYNNWF